MHGTGHAPGTGHEPIPAPSPQRAGSQPIAATGGLPGWSSAVGAAPSLHGSGSLRVARLALPFAAGNRAVAMVVQRESRADALAWLRTFLASGASAGATGLARAATRLAGWSADRQAHLIQQVRGDVDGFEVALGRAGLLGSTDAGRVLGILEGAQPTDALGTRLVTLFRASLEPTMGLVIAANTAEDRLRAALETNAGAAAGIAEVLRRNPAGSTPGPLRAIRARLAEIQAALASPGTAGVTASTPGREAQVTSILTPPAVANARAAAVAAGLPPPAFVPARYYEDLISALHTSMLQDWSWADPMNRRRTLDTSAGGHIEGIAAEAKRRVDALFGAYGSRAAPALSFSAGTLEDRGTISGDPFDLARWYVNEGSADRPAMAQAKEAHHAFEDAAAAQVIEASVISHYSGRTSPTVAAQVAAVGGLGMTTAERARRLTIIDRMWPGAASRGTVSVAAREGANRAETRAIYWGLFKTMLHEYLHTTENPTYSAWYNGLRDSHHQTTYQEGVTDLFTLKSWRSVHPNEIAANRSFRQRIQGTGDPDLDMRAVGGEPSHYAELAEAQQLEALIGEANLKAAYFRGNTAVLGGARLPR
jgi:hypothetical protein